MVLFHINYHRRKTLALADTGRDPELAEASTSVKYVFIIYLRCLNHTCASAETKSIQLPMSVNSMQRERMGEKGSGRERRERERENGGERERVRGTWI